LKRRWPKAQPSGNSHQQIITQADQREGKRKGGSHLPKNRSTRNIGQSKRMEGFPFEGMYAT